VATFRRITKREDKVELAKTAAKHEALLLEALEIAVRRAESKLQDVRDILSTGTVEGLGSGLNARTAAVSYKAIKYRRTWHSLIPWQYLENTTAEEEAESMIQTVENNIKMTETNSWPPLPAKRDPPKAAM
jgi:hypothetical protein